MIIFHAGVFGSRAATMAAAYCRDARLVELDQADAGSIATQCTERLAMVFLSTVSHPRLDTLATAFRTAGVVWTCVQLYPAMLRVGPLVRGNGICFDCATRRYLSNPGSDGLARLEELLRGASADRSVEFATVPATVVAMAVAEALRQLDDADAPAGIIRKIDFVEMSTSSAVAQPLHGCDCSAAASGKRAPGARFYLDLENDLQELTGDIG